MPGNPNLSRLYQQIEKEDRGLTSAWFINNYKNRRDRKSWTSGPFWIENTD
jgi:hypothetical protein